MKSNEIIIEDFNISHEKYKETSNPLFIWEYILRYRGKTNIFPDWVVEYLEDVAKELIKLDPSEGRVDRMIKHALCFTGKNFAQFSKEQEEHSIYLDVYFLIDEKETVVEAIKQVCKKRSLGFEKVKKIYYKEKKFYDEFEEMIKDENLDLNVQK